MTYDEKQTVFSMRGKWFAISEMKLAVDTFNSFFFDDGVIDVEPIRNTNGTLTELKQSSDTDFAARTEKEK